MLSKTSGALRLTFLGRFALVTFALAVVVANVLSYFLIRSHEAALDANEAASAAGQISALLTKPLSIYESASRRPSPTTTRELAAVEAAAKRFQYVLGIRLFDRQRRRDPHGIPTVRYDAFDLRRRNRSLA